MKTIKYISIGLLFLVPTTGFAEWCNWGFVPPKVYECNGKKYVYGSAACDSGMYTNIFCEQSKSKNGAECRDDDAPETIDCFNKNIAKSPPIKPEPRKSPPIKPETPKDEEGFCNWGFAGPQI